MTDWTDLDVWWKLDRDATFCIATTLVRERDETREQLTNLLHVCSHGHQSPCTLGPPCPFCEAERLRWERDGAREAARTLHDDLCRMTGACGTNYEQRWPWLTEGGEE